MHPFPTCSATVIDPSIPTADLDVILDLNRMLDRKIDAGGIDAGGIDARQLCRELLTTCYMATENNSQGTRQLAGELATDIGRLV